MTALTVLIVPDGPLQAVTSGLRDWSAAGIVADYAVATPQPPTNEIVVDLVCGGRLSRATLEGLLAERVPSLIRLVALTERSGSEAEAVRRTATLLAAQLTAGSGAHVSRTAIVLSPPTGSDREPTGLDGWHNVVIAPEDGRGPTTPHAAWPTEQSAHTRAALILPSLMVLAGLQHGVPNSPLDDEQPLPGTQFRVARGYVSRLDGRDVEARLRSELLSLQRGYPRVKDGSASSTYIENLSLATDQMAGRWWKATGPLLISPRKAMEKTGAHGLSLGAALRMFFSYMWAVIKGAPAEWLTRAIIATKTGVAGAATRTLFGSGSAYAVVVGGVRGDGKPVTWQERATALQVLDDSLPALTGEHVVHADLSRAWRRFIDGGLTLLDGVKRNDDLPSIEVGGQVGTIRRGTDVCPGHEGNYVLAALPVAAAVTVDQVPAHDYLGFVDLQSRLQDLGRDPQVGPAANAELHAAQSWWQGSRQRYAPRVAEAIGASLGKVVHEIRGYAEELKYVVEPPDLSLEEHRAQRRLARRIRVILLVGLLLMIASVVLGVFAIVAWAVAALMVVGWAVIILLGAMATWWRGQRQIFQLLHRLQETSARADVLDHNLRAAIRDAGRLADAYVLHQRWAQILGVFVADPFGTGAAKPGSTAVLDSTQPLAAHFATGAVDDVAVAQEAAQLGTSLFVAGWLGPVWEQYLAASVRSLGSQGVGLGAPEELYSQRATEGDTLLNALADQRMQEGAPPQTGDDTWAALLRKSARSGRPIERVIPKVRAVDGSEIPTHEFIRQLDAPGDPTVFRQTLFSSRGILDGSCAPGKPWSAEKTVGLSSVRSLAVLSPGMPPAHLVTFREFRPEDGEDHVDDLNGLDW